MQSATTSRLPPHLCHELEEVQVRALLAFGTITFQHPQFKRWPMEKAHSRNLLKRRATILFRFTSADYLARLVTKYCMWHWKQKVFVPLNPPWVGFVSVQWILIMVWAAEKARRRRAGSPGAPREGRSWCWTGLGWMWSSRPLPCSAMLHVTVRCLPHPPAVPLHSKPARAWVWLKSYHFSSNYSESACFLVLNWICARFELPLVGALKAQRPKARVGVGGLRRHLAGAAPRHSAAALPVPPGRGELGGHCRALPAVCGWPWGAELWGRGTGLFYTVLENTV